MKRQIAVIGVGKFGYKIIETLSQKGVPVIALDRNHDAIESVKELAVEAMQIDTLDKDALKASGVQEVDAVIVAMGTDIESSILIVAMLYEMGIKEIVARAKNHLHERILRQLGVTRVVFPEEDVAIRVANSIIQPGTQEYIELGDDFDLVEIEIVKGHKFIGKKLLDLNIRKNYNVNLIMIKKTQVVKNKNGEKEMREVKKLPYVDYEVVEGDIFVIVGDRKDIEKFGRIF